MKKILLIALTAIIGQAATAQKSNVKAAEVAYFAKDYEKGVKAITEAMNNEQTKADPKTYYLASLLFSSLNDDAANAAKAYYRTETNHLFSIIKLKADYEKDNVNILLMNCANSYFNAAQEAFFNEKNYQAAINHFDTVEMINKCGDGKRFAGNLAFDTVVALGKRLKVYAYKNLITESGIKQVRIKMNENNNQFKIPCKINGIPLNFIFDTGASDVSISSTEALFMLKNGQLNQSDIGGTVNYSIANGEIAKGTIINIKEIEFNGLILKNIKASVIHESNAPLLLGMSAISKLGKVEIKGNELSIETPNSGMNNNNDINYLTLVKEVAANPIVTNPDMYLFLLDAYEQQKDEANFMKTLADAKLKYADNKAIANRELNYYIKSGKQDELVKKLEDVVSKDPNNAELLFTLGITYENLSKNGKDKLGKPMVDPVLVGKAEASYLKAIQANGNQADYQYNLGALYYNNAVEINKQMNAIAGSSAAEIKKYEGLKKQRDDMFNKGLPYLAKAAEVVSSKEASTQNADDKSTLQSAYQAQVQIYNALGNKAKAEEYKKKISEIR